ncbi:hypothetical protein PEDI_43610 [Persicobacter diffluens]|uniref:Uncharacterized protein n=1 Tax=Persicobacter diffluens TaxID=981 RepID=A0AAN4W147_9BACT|nr:hypothetical protein PEDI_43610 [Persicobacter diffluens]
MPKPDYSGLNPRLYARRKNEGTVFNFEFSPTKLRNQEIASSTQIELLKKQQNQWKQSGHEVLGVRHRRSQ